MLLISLWKRRIGLAYIPMITIHRFSSRDEILFSQARKIRHEVFIVEQQVPPHLEYDKEEESEHYLIYDEGMPVGTARWRKTSAGIKLERFAVLSAFRGKGFGKIILDRVLQDVVIYGEKIYLHAQMDAVDYYSKAGFIVAGNRFSEAGIEHYLMVYSP